MTWQKNLSRRQDGSKIYDEYLRTAHGALNNLARTLAKDTLSENDDSYQFEQKASVISNQLYVTLFGRTQLVVDIYDQKGQLCPVTVNECIKECDSVLVAILRNYPDALRKIEHPLHSSAYSLLDSRVRMGGAYPKSLLDSFSRNPESKKSTNIDLQYISKKIQDNIDRYEPNFSSLKEMAENSSLNKLSRFSR